MGSDSQQTTNTETVQLEEPEKGSVSDGRRINLLEDQFKEIRRDELNYQIEKDLLKETYSSNLQTLNLVLTIVLGLFSIIGFLGIRDIHPKLFGMELN